jgi:hypothetical protein
MGAGTAPYNNVSLMQSLSAGLNLRHVRDNFILAYAGNGVYSNMASLASGSGPKFDLIADPRQLTTSQVLGQIADIGASAVETVEGANEYDISGDPNWPATVTAYQSSLYSTIKGSANPYPVFCFSLVGSIPSDLTQVGNQSAAIDFGSMHQYNSNVPPVSYASGFPKTYAAFTAIATPKPVYTTETGFTTTTPGITQLSAAKYITRTYLDFLAAGIPRTYIYEFADESNLSGAEGNYGIVTSSGSPKTAYTWLANLNTILVDSGSAFSPGSLTYTMTGGLANITTSLFEKRNGHYFIVIWDEAVSFNANTNTDIAVPTQPVLISNLSQSFSSWNYYDISVSASPQSSGTSASVQLNVPDYPVILELIP